MDVQAIKMTDVTILDFAAKLALPDKVNGCSAGAGKSRIHLIAEADPNDVQIATNVLANYGALDVAVVRSVINADNVDAATITYPTSDSMHYIVVTETTIWAQGTASPVSGTVTLTMATPVPGTYDVHLLQATGVGTGSVKVRAY